ncbi:MAG: SPOR domain-containing protein [Planctomycetota bacterium]
MATNEKSRKPIEMNEPDDGEFRLEEGKAVSRTHVVRTHRSTVIVENAPFGIGKMAAILAQRAPSLVVLCLVALISFFIGRLTANDAQASQTSANAADPITQASTVPEIAQLNEPAPVEPAVETAAVVTADTETETVETALINSEADSLNMSSSVINSGGSPNDNASDSTNTGSNTSASTEPVDSASTNANFVASETGESSDQLINPARANDETFHQPAKSGQFTIQIRAYRMEDDAVAAILIGRLRQRGLAPVFKIVRKQNRLLVCVGAFDSRNDKNLAAILQVVNGMLDRPADGIVRF